jgi:branched-chain amino acid transport system substrate-binding protein
MTTGDTSRRRITAKVLIALACSFAAACGDTRQGAAGDSVVIGVASIHSTGQPFFQGVQLAVEILNAQRPSGSAPFAMRLPPLEQPTQVAVAAGFRDAPEVIGVVGHPGSGPTMEAAPIYADVEHGGANALVAVTPTATNPAVTRLNDWVFRVCPTDVDGARALARFIIDSVKARNPAIIYRNDLFGRGFTAALGRELQNAGIALAERDPYLAGVTEWDAYTQRMVRRGVDAMIVAGGGPDAGPMIRSARRAGGSFPVLGSDDFGALKEAQPGEFDGVRFIMFFDRTQASGDAAAFVAAYQKRFGSPPNHQAALSYDAAMIIGKAVLAVGADRGKVRDWIAQIGRAQPAYNGVTGEIRFDEEGDPVNKSIVIGSVAK